MSRLEALLAGPATVVLDGATGTECERRGVPVLPNAWSGGAALSHPDVLRGIHVDYIRAGARIIIANTFATHRHVLEAAGVAEDFVAHNRRAVELAVQARDEAGDDTVVVAAGISNWTFAGEHPALDVLRVNAAEQAAVHAAAGAELLILEMMVDINRMRATLEGAARAGLPVWVGLTSGSYGVPPAVDGVPRLRDGETLADAVAALAGHDVGALVVMHTDVTLVDGCLDVVLREWAGPVAVYAHSGDFVDGEWVFDDVISPAEYAEHARGWADRGVRVIGGCCGTGPDHVRALVTALR